MLYLVTIYCIRDGGPSVFSYITHDATGVIQYMPGTDTEIDEISRQAVRLDDVYYDGIIGVEGDKARADNTWVFSYRTKTEPIEFGAIVYLSSGVYNSNAARRHLRDLGVFKNEHVIRIRTMHGLLGEYHRGGHND